MRFTVGRFRWFAQGKDWQRGVDKAQQTVSRQPEIRKVAERHEELGDFSTTLRVVPISALAVVIGAICAFVALALLRLIGFFTNVFYFGRWSAKLIPPRAITWVGSAFSFPSPGDSS